VHHEIDIARRSGETVRSDGVRPHEHERQVRLSQPPDPRQDFVEGAGRQKRGLPEPPARESAMTASVIPAARAMLSRGLIARILRTSDG